jgi:hypothetical protein
MTSKPNTSKPNTTTAEIYYDDENLHSSVQVAGEFSSWDSLPLSNTESSTKYSTVVKDLIPGHSYMYKFIVDGEWILASDGRPITDDDESNVNHFLVAPALEEESSKPEDADEEESFVKETAFDAEEEPEALAPTIPLDQGETLVSAPPASSAKVATVDKALAVAETKQPEVSTKPESFKQPEPDLAVPVKEAAPLEKAKAIEPINAADASTTTAAAPATTVSAVSSTNPTIPAAAGEETSTPNKALKPTAETVAPTKPAEPVKPVEQAKPVEDIPAKERPADVTAAAAPAVPAAAAAFDASAVAPSTNNVVSQPPVSGATHEATTADSVSRNSSRSVKSPLSTETSTGKDADGQSHHTYFNPQEQETKPSFDSASPASATTTSPAATPATTGTAPNTAGDGSGPGNGAGPASGGADDHKRSWLSRLFSFFARLFK